MLQGWLPFMPLMWKNTSITFEYIVPSAEEFADRSVTLLPVILTWWLNWTGEPAGYAYASAFKKPRLLMTGLWRLPSMSPGSSKQRCRQSVIRKAGGIPDRTARLQCLCLHHLPQSSQHRLPRKSMVIKPWHIFTLPVTSRMHGMI